MRHIKLFENFSVNEGTDYSTLGNRIPFKMVVKYLQDYQDEASIACLGYNDKKDKFHVIPLSTAKYDDKVDYIACLMTVDSKKWKAIAKQKAENLKKVANDLSIKGINSLIDSIGKSKGEKSLHSFVHLTFDDGKLIGAERFGANDVEWFVDEYEMADEHSDEYQEYMEEGMDDDDN